MENVDYLRKLAELVQSSQSSIEELYSLVAEASRFYLAIASTFPYLFGVIFSAYPQVLIFSRAVSRINLSRFNLVLPQDFSVQQETQLEEENVTPYIPTKLNSAFQWQTELLSKVAPTLKSLSSAHLEYERKLFMPEPMLSEKLTEETATRGSPLPETSFLNKAKEILPKEPAASLLKPLPARPKIDRKPSHLPKELSSEKEASQGLRTGGGLSSETLGLLIESAALPNLIFEKQLPFLKIAGTLSRISAGAEIVSMPIHEVTQDQSAKISPSVPMPQPQISSLLHEIAPSLTSWIYEGSEVLRDTGVPLSAVPIAASEAERVVSETLAEPTATTVVAQPPIEWKPTTVPSSISRLPTLIALAGAGSLINQRLSDELAALKKEAKIEKAVAMTRPAQNVREWPVVDRSTEELFVSPPGRFVISPIGTALLGKPVMTPSTVLVHSQFLWEKMRESQDVANGSLLSLEAASRSYELPVLEYSYAAQHPKQGKTDFWSRTREAHGARGSSTVSPATDRMSPVIPTIDITEPDDAAEEDLRDLERKISRILSEQLSRYYGTSQM
jgi:hypothetical protein